MAAEFGRLDQVMHRPRRTEESFSGGDFRRYASLESGGDRGARAPRSPHPLTLGEREDSRHVGRSRTVELAAASRGHQTHCP